MPTNHTRLRQLLLSYAQGTIAPDDALELQQYIIDPSNQEAIDLVMAELWEHEPVVHSLESPLKDQMPSQIVAMRPKRRTSWYRYAAVLMCLILAGSASYYFGLREVKSYSAIPGDRENTEEPKALVLADGSTVLLKDGSRLEYPLSFDGKATRSVTLTGEGYFDIVHDDSKPFVVHTGTLQTRVLGTAFVIKAYDDEKKITVTVSRGKVQVADDNHVLATLMKDQQVTFDKESQVAAQQIIKSDSTIAWARQDIHFDDITFGEATSKLSERFGVKMHFENTRASQCRFTATFIEGESFIHILEVICAFNHANYRQVRPGEYVIEGKGC